MMRHMTLVCVLGLVLGAANGLAQVPDTAPPTAAETLLSQPPAVTLSGSEDRRRGPGVYAATGVLVAPPILYDAMSSHSHDTTVMPPIPSPWAAIGFRRANDVSWQVASLIVPLLDPSDPLAAFTWGFDLDRISTNRCRWEDTDVRWQVGVRFVGIALDGAPLPFALGPHTGLRWERRLSDRTSAYGWGDVGVLPTIFSGIPVVDLRAELGLTWRPAAAPGLTCSVGLFNENIGIVIAGFMTPGIKFRLGWRF